MAFGIRNGSGRHRLQRSWSYPVPEKKHCIVRTILERVVVDALGGRTGTMDALSPGTCGWVSASGASQQGVVADADLALARVCQVEEDQGCCGSQNAVAIGRDLSWIDDLEWGQTATGVEGRHIGAAQDDLANRAFERFRRIGGPNEHVAPIVQRRKARIGRGAIVELVGEEDGGMDAV